MKVLEPLEVLTRTLSGHKYVTCSSVLILAKGLQNELEKMKTDETFTDPSVKSLISTLLSSNQVRLGNLDKSKTLRNATFLEPRFKRIMFDEKMQNKVREDIKKVDFRPGIVRRTWQCR